MPTTKINWYWEEAFDKFGFGDGGGWNGTDLVSDAIEELGYQTECAPWGCHNHMIMDILKDGKSILPPDIDVGYDDPNNYLPDDILEILDSTFDDKYEV